MKVNSDITIVPSDIFKEYEYMYDDDTKPYMLRQHSQNTEQVKETNNLDNSKKLPLTDFYNLEPAISHLNLSYNHSENDNVWYIQDDLPCWDLPLLYGELSKKKKYSEVFTMRGGELKNVIVNDSSVEWFSSVNKRVTSPPTYTNKWCMVEPCYGDHTLCLFSRKTSSSLCNKNYEVIVPSILEHTALVNTINSMRNKIANGESHRYSYLPPAANMKQIIYDYDLEEIAAVWLHQCLPGSAPCSALDGSFVTQLECTKYAKYCCKNPHKAHFTKCIPKPECFILPVIGCLHVWFWSAGSNLTTTDVLCGHTSVLTYNTVQLLWATTNKIGYSKYYCGIVGYKEKYHIQSMENIVDSKVLMSLGINLKKINKRSEPYTMSTTEPKLKEFGEHSDSYWGVNILSKIYNEGWVVDILDPECEYCFRYVTHPITADKEQNDE
ncbi:uncharacterized protein [Epargyreus clarus]|uniref:uncharacterized protein n=1 Tax=Epargyreus clarus TaxID=520877 RepID=UPI003C30B344